MRVSPDKLEAARRRRHKAAPLLATIVALVLAVTVLITLVYSLMRSNSTGQLLAGAIETPTATKNHHVAAVSPQKKHQRELPPPSKPPPPSIEIANKQKLQARYKQCMLPQDDFDANMARPLQHVALFKNTKPAAPSLGVTLASSLNLARLDMLTKQCIIWPGLIAAVLYAPVSNGRTFSFENPPLAWDHLTLAEMTKRIDEWHRSTQKTGLCYMDLEFVIEEFDNISNDTVARAYPINALRNRAIELSNTAAVLHVDADFLPSSRLAQDYTTPESYQALLQFLHSGISYVLPVFNTKPTAKVGTAVAMTMLGKADLFQAYNDKKLFLWSGCPPCQAATNYTRWFESDTSYEMKLDRLAEPFLLAGKLSAPYYDERFRGYHMNKIIQRSAMASLGIKFIVHPDYYLIHMPHPPSSSKTYMQSNVWLRDSIYRMAGEIKQQIGNNTYLPVTATCGV